MLLIIIAKIARCYFEEFGVRPSYFRFELPELYVYSSLLLEFTRAHVQ